MVDKCAVYGGQVRGHCGKDVDSATVICSTVTMANDIVMANPLIEACYNPPNITQMRLLFACLLQIKADELIDTHRPFELSAGGLSDLFGNVKGNNYGYLKKATTQLMEWNVKVSAPPNAKDGDPDEEVLSVIDRCRYFDGEGRVMIYFGTGIAPYISGLHKFFTPIDPDNFLDLKTGYGARLYTIFLKTVLAAGQPQVVREYTIPEFREQFGLQKKYPDMRDLLRRVIRPGLKDINNSENGMQVKFGTRTIRRKIIAFQFDIDNPLPAKTKQAGKGKAKALPGPGPQSFEQFVKQHAKPGESEQRARDRLQVSWQQHQARAG